MQSTCIYTVSSEHRRKMLYTVAFCAIMLSSASALTRPKDQELYHLPPEVALKAEKFTRPCIEKYNADPNIFGKLLDGTMPNDDVSKNFLICFSVSGKFTDEEGHFNISRMSDLIGNHRLLKEFQQALTECNKRTKETPRETVYEMSLCINEVSPVAFSL